MKLPTAFLDKMHKLLDDTEYQELIAALNGQRQYGLRVNTLKISVEEMQKLLPNMSDIVPWTIDGFYLNGDDTPGKHPYYHAGLYYIQEPSAMLPGQILGAQPGEKILDLCAAPGGKTVQIAAAMKGKGLLVSNDINTERVKALVKNIELCGVRNAIVLNESPERIAQKFEGYFDRVIIDAPCSGEGMFRKDESAARSWESFKCERCTKLQEPILQSADLLLKPGGTLVYSTCTFSPEEDEQMIERFITAHSQYELADIPKIVGIEGGRPKWADGDENISHAARLWPHRVRGEGHFVAKLIKKPYSNYAPQNEIGTIISSITEPGSIKEQVWENGKAENSAVDNASAESTSIDISLYNDNVQKDTVLAYEELPAPFKAFMEDNLNYFPDGVFLMKGQNIYHLPQTPPRLDGLKIAKFGWFLGCVANNKFEPSHSIVTALDNKAFKRVVDLKADSREINSYLKGETLMLEGQRGMTAVCVDGYTVGWAKQTGDMLKNLYPKGWRRLS